MGCWPLKWPRWWQTSSLHHHSYFLVWTQRAEWGVARRRREGGMAAILLLLSSAVLELSLWGGDSPHTGFQSRAQAALVMVGPTGSWVAQCWRSWCLAVTGVSLETHVIAAFQYLKGAYRKDGEGLFTRVYIRYEEEILHHEGGETLEQVAQRSCGCPLPGSVQGQVGRSSEQTGLVEDVPAHGRRVGTRWSLRSLPTQTILWWFYDSLMWCYLKTSFSWNTISFPDSSYNAICHLCSTCTSF